MTISKIQIFKTRINGILSTLKSATEKQKSGPVSVHIADNFNSILKELRIDFPEIASALPNDIQSDRNFADMGFAKLNYLDLEIYCNTIIGLLSLVDK